MFTDNDNDMTDELGAQALTELLGQRPVIGPTEDDAAPVVDGQPPRPTRRDRPGGRLLAVAALLLAAGGVAVVARTVTSSDDEPAAVTSTTLPVAGAAIPASLLGPITGTRHVNGQPLRQAFPGELVTAPKPRSGTATAWRWELCPSRNAGADECTTIGDATDATWTSPATAEPIYIRVAVTVQLGGVLVDVVSEPYQAMPEPVAATTAPAETTVVATTTVPTNAFGDAVGATITESASPAGTLALAAASRAQSSPAAGSNAVALLLQWVHQRTADDAAAGAAGSVTATADGYRVVIGSTGLEFREFTGDGTTITDVTVCLDGGGCGAVSAAIVMPVCPPEVAACGTVTASERGMSAIHRATVIGIPPGVDRLYETISEHPLAAVSMDQSVKFSNGWFLIVLPSEPPAGAHQDLAVAYADATPADMLRIDY